MISRLIDSDIYIFLIRQILLYDPPKRLSKYPITHYLNILLFILKTGCSFRDSCIFLSLPPNHFTTVFKKFSSWSSQGILEIIYEKLVEAYSIKYFKNIKILDLFIDSSNIRNKNGETISFL